MSKPIVNDSGDELPNPAVHCAIGCSMTLADAKHLPVALWRAERPQSSPSFPWWPLSRISGSALDSTPFAFGGISLLSDLFRKLPKREFGSDLLGGISIMTSLALGEYLAGSIIVLMLSGGETLEHYGRHTRHGDWAEQ